MDSKIKKRNGEISILKFLFSMLILAYHLGNNFGKFSFAYMGVEFFFIVSGFYLCKSTLKKEIADKDIAESTFKFIIKKTIRFVPYYILIVLLSLPIWIKIDNYNLNQIINSIGILFYIPNNTSTYTYTITMITWYINAMILIEFIMYPLLLKFKKNVIYIISPMIVFVSFCFIIINYGIIGEPWQTTTFCFKGIVRALMDINIGIFIYGLVEKIKNKEYTELSRFLFTIFEILGYALVVYLSNRQNAMVEVIILVITSLCLIITLSETDYLHEFCDNKLFCYLEKLGLPIYLFQFIFIDLLLYLNTKFKWGLNFTKLYILLIIILILFGMLILKFFDLISKNKKAIKKIFIKDVSHEKIE